jgi:2'-5' RNA ligase
MGFDPNGVLFQIPAEQRLNVFALVIYIPDPLGRFLDDLRRELVPGCNPHAHVSVLPPRPIAVDWRIASEQVCRCAKERSTFEVTLGNICRFPVTNVIYLELAKGSDEFFEMHNAINSDALAFDEPFAYHPHVTLAQEIPPDSVEEVDRKARRMWAEYDGPRSFLAERTAFVQNTLGNCWIDLAECNFSTVTV